MRGTRSGGNSIPYAVQERTRLTLLRCAPLCLLLLLLSAVQTHGSDIQATINDVLDKGNRIWVTYDLFSPGPAEITLVGQTPEGESIRLAALDGDVGPKVPEGPDRVIEWRYLEDYPNGMEGIEVVLDLVASPSGEDTTSSAEDTQLTTCEVASLAGYIGDPGSDTRAISLALEEAETSDAKVLIIEIDGIGDAVETNLSTALKLIQWQKDNPEMRVVGFVRGEASGTAVFPLLACAEIYLSDKAKLGAPAANEDGAGTVTLPDAALAIERSKAFAREAGIDPLLLASFFNPEATLYFGKEWSKAEAKLVSLPPKSYFYQGIGEYEQISEKGATLRLGATEAVRLGVASGTAQNLHDLIEHLDIGPWKLDNASRRTLIRSERESWDAYHEYQGTREEVALLISDIGDDFLSGTERRQAAEELEELLPLINEDVEKYPQMIGEQFKTEFSSVSHLRQVIAEVPERKTSSTNSQTRVEKRKRPKRVAKARKARRPNRRVRRPPQRQAPSRNAPV